jgi:hypothetical protein
MFRYFNFRSNFQERIFMKKILFLAVLCGLAFWAGVSHAQPQAKEIAFARPCPDGVPVYSKSTNTVACGALTQSGSGYVIEMASATSQAPACPSGFSYIGNLDKDSLAQRGIAAEGSLQYFACVKE